MSEPAGETLRYQRGMPVVDADVHVAVPEIAALYPYLSEHWHDTLIESGVTSLEVNTYPRGCDFSARPDARPESQKFPPGSSLEIVQRQLLEPWNVETAVALCDYGVHVLHNEDLAVAVARGVNDLAGGPVALQGQAVARLHHRLHRARRPGGG